MFIITTVRSSALLLLVTVLLASYRAFAGEPINTLERSGFIGYEPSGVAIKGADTVAYFTQGKYIGGTDEFTTDWRGATWKFVSQDHLDLFIADPQKYAPQYGGYCAYGVSQNYLVKIEPENWTIVEGKLYLNYNDGVQATWEQNIAGYINLADARYEDLVTE